MYSTGWLLDFEYLGKGLSRAMNRCCICSAKYTFFSTAKSEPTAVQVAYSTNHGKTAPKHYLFLVCGVLSPNLQCCLSLGPHAPHAGPSATCCMWWAEPVWYGPHIVWGLEPMHAGCDFCAGPPLHIGSGPSLDQAHRLPWVPPGQGCHATCSMYSSLALYTACHLKLGDVLQLALGAGVGALCMQF